MGVCVDGCVSECGWVCGGCNQLYYGVCVCVL